MSKRFCLALVALLASSGAWAVPITFTYAGTGSGALGALNFENVDFTITAVGDTDDRQTVNTDIFYIEHAAASISIAGIGSVDFITGTRTFLNSTQTSTAVVGFSREGQLGLDLFNSSASSELGAWDMLSSIGPIGSSFRLIQWSNSAVVTNLGNLFFTSDQARGTFQATIGTAVPEPTTLALLSFGILGLGARRRRSRR